jgi:CubicO group peptidase (beta-lactamase class C family)
VSAETIAREEYNPMLRPIVIALALSLSFAPRLVAEGSVAFPGKAWEVVQPEAEGLDSKRLQEAIDTLKQKVGKDGVKELVIVRRGRALWLGDDVDKVHGVWSCTKSFTSTVLGLLIADGKVSLETKAAALFPLLHERYPLVTLRHFTTMTSGYRAAGDAEATGGYLHGPSTRPFEPAEPLFGPGEKYAYWDSAMNTLGLCLTAAAEEPLDELLRRRVMDPIGADPKKWKWGDRGMVTLAGRKLKVNSGSGNAGGHIQISARELARFGHLVLNRGKWRSEQLIPAEWVQAATQAQVPASLADGFPRSDIPGSGAYGYNWWVNGKLPGGSLRLPDAPPQTFSANGHNNNRLWVIPEWQMVIVRLGQDQADRRLKADGENEFLKLVGAAIQDGGTAP